MCAYVKALTGNFDTLSAGLVRAGVVLMLLCASSPANAGRRVAVMPMEGPKAGQIQSIVVSRMRVGHTVITPAEATAIGRRLGSGVTCTPAILSRLAVSVRADALICGSVDAPGQQLQLIIHNGDDGKPVTTLDIPLTEGGFTAAELTSTLLRIEAALALTSRPSASSQPVSTGDPFQDALKLLSAPVADDRIAALLALSRQNDVRASAPMSCALLKDPEIRVRTAAAGHLGAVDDLVVLSALRAAAARETDGQLRQGLRDLLAKLPQRVGALVVQLGSNDPQKRRQAARVLGRGATPGALKPLIRALGDQDSRVRLRAVEGLRNFAEHEARAALGRVMGDPDPDVRRAAGDLVRAHQRLSAWRKLFRSYLHTFNRTRSTKPAERQDAVYALGIRSSDTAERRLARMMLSDGDERVRIATAWTLVLLGGERGEAALKIAADNDTSQKVRDAVRQYLKIGDADLAAMTRKLYAAVAGVRQRTAAALSLRPTKVIVPHLVTMALCDRDAAARATSLLGLARASSTMALDTLKAVLYRDPSAEVRRAAVMMYVLVVWKDAPTAHPEVAAEEKPDTEDPLKAKPATVVEKHKADRPADPADPACPLKCKALQVRVGPSSLLTRNLTVDNSRPRFYEDDEDGMSSTPVAGFDVGLDLYPATWFSKNWLSNFGIGASYSRFFGLRWNTAGDQDTIHDMTHEVLTVDFIKVRWQPVRRPGVPTLHARFGLHYLNLSMNDEDVSDAFIVPDISATSLSLGVAIEIPIKSGYLRAGFDYLPTMSWGEVMEDEEFGMGDGWGIKGTIGIGGPFNDLLGWRLDLNYTYYAVELDRDNTDAARNADGIIDMYFHGRASLTFNL